MIINTNNAFSSQTKCSSNCSSVGYAYDYIRGCLLWNDQAFDLKNISVDVGADNYRPSFFLKLANNDLDTRNETDPRDAFREQEKIMIVVLISFLTLLIVGLFVYCYWRRKLSRKGEDLRHFDVGMSVKVNSSELRRR
ncbi:hypothetical protein L6164_018528 [Bauhinia variegata]|uniref:Uncharacterized protein n=1 Tax=Bauhinia variegata TaxID=167791 RepID=A0ACB9NBH3_BAUVA|nr:hypothetical protein L6164_018528 [Bauhinia variegata]